MDEFSDFQMAVGPHHGASRGGEGLKAQNGLWVLEHSVRHPTSSFPIRPGTSNTRSAFDGFRPQQFNSLFTPASNKHTVEFAPPPGPVPLVKSVGSRLANYNLGSRQSLQLETSFGALESVQSVQSLSHHPQRPLSNGGGGTGHGVSNSGPSLLMGEEDKYAALRVLVNADVKDYEPTEAKTFPEHSFGFGSAQQDVNVTESDFGDFQSFSGVKPQAYADLGTSFGTAKAGVPFRFEPQSNFISSQKITGLSSSFTKDPIPSPDNEFGDFVSVEQSIVENPPESTLKEVNTVTDCFQDLLGSQWNSEVKDKPNSDIDWISALTDNPCNETQGISKISEVLQSPTFTATPQIPAVLSNTNILENVQKQASITHLPLPLTSTKNDLVEANDSIARCASVNDMNNDSLEFGFFAQKDVFSSCLNTRNPSVDISPESRSIASLDLGNYCTSTENCDIGKNPEQLFPYESEEIVGKETNLCIEAPFAPSKSVQQYDFIKANTLHSSSVAVEDKYQCFKEELDTDKEKCLSHWIRCLESCKNLLSNAISLFNVVSSSDVIREIVGEDKGCGYIKDLVAVYRVYCRIMTSISRTGKSNQVGNIGNEIQNGWEILISFFLGTSVMEILAASTDDLSIRTSCDQQKLCGVCQNPDDGFDDLVEYEGNTYHSSCANLWINVLDTNLPLLPQIPF